MEKYLKTLGIYCVDFNIMTIGHLNIIEKAERIFDEVIVSIGVNPDKVLGEQHIEKILESRIKTINRQLPSRNVECFTGLLTDYVREKEEQGYNVVVIRGLRSGVDFDFEYMCSRYVWDDMPSIKYVYIPCDPMYTHVSSSFCKSLESNKLGSSYKYLAREIDNKEVLDQDGDIRI